jgi:hypothetical protein
MKAKQFALSTSARRSIIGFLSSVKEQKEMSFEKEWTKQVFDDADRRLAGHSIEVLFSQGLYRHYRCRNNGSWNDGFEIVTWPRSLCYTGDMGEYLFQRTKDMIAFMRGSIGSHSYVAEMCAAHGTRNTGSAVKEFRKEELEELLDEVIQDAVDAEVSPSEIVEMKERIQEIRDSLGDDKCPEDAYRAISDSGIWDGCDFPDCETFTFRFLWCLRAIEWFLKTLDEKGADAKPIE